MFDADNGSKDHENQFSEAFTTSTGFTQIGMTLFLAIKSYHRKGGTIDEFRRIVERAVTESDWPNDLVNVNPSTKTSGGADTALSKDQSVSATSVRPTPKEPSKGYLTAAAAGGKEVAVELLDTFKVRDGRAIGAVRFGELESLRVTNSVEARVIYQIQHHANAAHDARVRDVIKDHELRRFIENARRHAA